MNKRKSNVLKRNDSITLHSFEKLSQAMNMPKFVEVTTEESNEDKQYCENCDRLFPIEYLLINEDGQHCGICQRCYEEIMNDPYYKKDNLCGTKEDWKFKIRKL